MKWTLTVLLPLLAPATSAQAGLDHINPIGSDLVSTATQPRIQIYRDVPGLSRMIIDDFVAEQGTVDSASFALELANQDIGHPDGWRVSFWETANDAATSTNDFTGNTVATKYVDFAETSDWLLTPIFGAGSNSQAYRLDLLNLDLEIGIGVRYIGIAPVQNTTVTPLWHLLAHNSPAVLGNGTANDSVGINPSGTLGLGTQYSIATNAAYSVTMVPEPASVFAFGFGAVSYLVRRRRR